MKTVYDQDKELINFALNDYFYKGWKGKSEDIKEIELIVSPDCNLGCEYCYIHNFRSKLFPKESLDKNQVYRNSEMVIDWIISERFKLNVINIFSGELFAQEIGFKILDMIYMKFIENEYVATRTISIPTNFSFILDMELSERVESIIEKFKLIGVRIHLSASLDGKYLEDSNRPIIRDIDIPIKNKERDESFYDKAFEFIKKHRMGIHPMIYSDGIKKWKENLIWYVDKYEEHGLRWESIFLLEVRNKEWTLEQSKDIKEFMKWLVLFSFEKLGNDKARFKKFIRKEKGLHILGSIYGTSNKGLSCSIQNTMMIRLGDLNIVPCHRTMYSSYSAGKIKVEDGKILGNVEPGNVELYLSILGHDMKNSPYCFTCPIKNICAGGCLGSQMEVTGDLFTPIPSMCVMEHAKSAGIIEGLLEIDMYYELLSTLSKNQIKDWEYLRREIEKNENKRDEF